jgi:branched-chain amino acid transport system substrate-binding protein
VHPMDRRQALKLLAALGGGGLVAACNSEGEDAGAPVSDQQVRIGLVAPQTGGYKAIGDDIVRGFQLFLELNDGRLGAHPVQLVVADEGDTADSGKAAVEGLLKQGVLALTGIVSSAVMSSIRDTVEQARVPLIGSNASPSDLTGVVYIWRTSYVNTEPGLALGPYVARELKQNQKVGIIAPDYLAGRDSVDGFREGFGRTDPRLLPVVWTEFVTQPTRAFYRPAIDRLLAGKPTAIYCFFAGQAAVEFIKQLYAAGFRGKIYAPGFLTEGTVLEEFDREANNVYTTPPTWRTPPTGGSPRRSARPTTRRRPRTRWPPTTRRRCSTRRCGSPVPTPTRPGSTSLWARSGRSTARAAAGSSTRRVRRSSAGTCAGCRRTARSWPTC